MGVTELEPATTNSSVSVLAKRLNHCTNTPRCKQDDRTRWSLMTTGLSLCYMTYHVYRVLHGNPAASATAALQPQANA